MFHSKYSKEEYKEESKYVSNSIKRRKERDERNTGSSYIISQGNCLNKQIEMHKNSTLVRLSPFFLHSTRSFIRFFAESTMCKRRKLTS